MSDELWCYERGALGIKSGCEALRAANAERRYQPHLVDVRVERRDAVLGHPQRVGKGQGGLMNGIYKRLHSLWLRFSNWFGGHFS